MRNRARVAALGFVAIAAGCSAVASLARDSGEGEPGNKPRIPASATIPDVAALPATPRDAEATVEPPADAAIDPPLVPSAALHVFARRGSATDDATAPTGPGLLLDGGFSGASTRVWMHATAAGGVASRGDVVVLSPQASDAAGGWLTAAPFASVQTVALTDGATDADYRLAAELVRRAEVVWLTGGDQAKYVRWKGTPLMNAVQSVFDRGGVVGGTSAGMIVLGASVNDALNTLSENITTPLAVANPYDPKIHFTQNVVTFSFLRRSITDPHFIARDRMGRLSVFMARQVADGLAAPDILGIGIDDGAALAIGRDGRARRLASGDGPGIYVVRGGAPSQATAGLPLVYRGLHVVKLGSADHEYDFARRCGHGLVRTFDVDGRQTPPYGAEVYADGALANECPP